jgi:hypothetical protein
MLLGEKKVRVRGSSSLAHNRNARRLGGLLHFKQCIIARGGRQERART